MSCFKTTDDDDYFKKSNRKSCIDKKERLKKFTISVFVDSFEDYSFNKTMSDSSSSTINNSACNNSTISPKEAVIPNKNVAENLVDENTNSLKEFELNSIITK